MNANAPPTAQQLDTKTELRKCQLSVFYFILTYIQIYDATLKAWIPFALWAAQEDVLQAFLNNPLVIVLKARQLGLTWLALAYALWLMLFHPIATVALFSRRDTESIYLLSEERIRGMYNELPNWMRFHYNISESAHNWRLPNQSSAKAFPANAGDSYTFSLAIVDEADIAPDLAKLMTSVKPTIDGGGQMFLISRADKSTPESEFKNIYRGAKAGLTKWKQIFLPWKARPERDNEWYETQRQDIISRTGSTDDLLEQYPATDTEALSPRTQDKRLPPLWLEKCYTETKPLSYDEIPNDTPAIPELRIYRLPEPNKTYRIGADTAEGNPTSDDSALVVTDVDFGEEVASVRGKMEPAIQAAYTDQLGRFYNNADILVERNNHGHATILWLKDNSDLVVLQGEDKKDGWLSSSLGKTRLYDEAAETFRNENTILHSFDIFIQLSNIEGATLRAPAGQMDDLADAYVLAQVARRLASKRENFVELEWWDKCKEETPPMAKGEAAIIALGSAMRIENPGNIADSFAIVVVTRHPGRKQDVMIRYCGIWEAQPDQLLDFNVIEAELRRLCKEFSIVEICYDSDRVQDMATRLKSEQIANFRPFPQAGRRGANKQLQDLIIGKRISQDGNPLLRQHIKQANIEKWGEGIKIVERNGRRIEAVIALSMAVNRCLYLNLG